VRTYCPLRNTTSGLHLSELTETQPYTLLLWFNTGARRHGEVNVTGIGRVEKLLLEGLARLCRTPPGKCCASEQGGFISTAGDLITFNRGDLLLCTDFDWEVFYTEQVRGARQSSGVCTFGVLYDLISVLFPQYFAKDFGDRFKRLFLLTAGAYDGLLAISERTADDFRCFCAQHAVACPPIEVIRLGDRLPSPHLSPSTQVATFLDQPFILFVSTIERRKNHDALYKAYHFLRAHRPDIRLPKLIFVGKQGWGVNELMTDLQLDPLVRGHIVLLHDCNDADLMALYQKALFCVYPSFYEGWGLPVGEALALGKAVLCSDQGSLPEVGGDLVRYVSPWNALDWAEAIAEWTTSPHLVQQMEDRVRENYRAQEWSDTAKQVLDFIERISAAKR
jgi:glycosyltransferase involved in cell wall biosynthesis